MDCLNSLSIFYRDELPTETATMYAECLSDIPERDLREACARCMKTWQPEKQRMPLPSELVTFVPSMAEREREHNNAYYARQNRDALLEGPQDDGQMTPGAPRFDSDGIPLTMMDARKQWYGVIEKICGVEPGTFLDPTKKQAWKDKQAKQDNRRQKIKDRADLAYMMRGEGSRA